MLIIIMIIIIMIIIVMIMIIIIKLIVIGNLESVLSNTFERKVWKALTLTHRKRTNGLMKHTHTHTHTHARARTRTHTRARARVRTHTQKTRAHALPKWIIGCRDRPDKGYKGHNHSYL